MIGAPGEGNGYAFLFDWASTTSVNFNSSWTAPAPIAQTYNLGQSVAIDDRFMVAGGPLSVDTVKEYVVTVVAAGAGFIVWTLTLGVP